jgi:hypothetical protein
MKYVSCVTPTKKHLSTCLPNAHTGSSFGRTARIVSDDTSIFLRLGPIKMKDQLSRITHEDVGSSK